MNRHHTRHEYRHAILTNRFDNLDRPQRAPVELEWNRDASAILVLVTLGCFIMAAAVLITLFVDLNTGGLQ